MRWIARKLCSVRGMVYFLIAIHLLFVAFLLFGDDPLGRSGIGD